MLTTADRDAAQTVGFDTVENILREYPHKDQIELLDGGLDIPDFERADFR